LGPTLTCALVCAPILKPLMEKRRRDRINVSLSRLQSLVLPAQVLVEKAEILEHTVQFLTDQSSGPPQRSQGPPEQLYLSFQDGFSTCLHRAARFLESGEKTQWLTPTLDAALSRRGMDPCSVSIPQFSMSNIFTNITSFSMLNKSNIRVVARANSYACVAQRMPHV
uniref:BHLH domain-containing protein n=1 Tax=Periophthalmus magnuspinnatus TaxID=409849 RepID=A0A3B4A8B3_9GOBI